MKKTCIFLVMTMILSPVAEAAGRHVHLHKAQTHHVHRKDTTSKAEKSKSEIGFATWYANGRYKNKNGFHRYTSNHEKLNSNSMTCAHRNLPFNTIVEVENINTGKVIYVRVNDRMRAKPPRIIDLTAGAAKALGIFNTGIAKVKIKPLPIPVEVAEAPPPTKK